MQKTALIILDGWGLAPGTSSNAISTADTPVFDGLMATYPNTTLNTSGEDVGLPPGQMGNSEVGHLNIGAGRIVWQELANINKAIREGTIDHEPVLVKAFEKIVQEDGTLHLAGLVSDGGVHSHINHLKHLCTLASAYGLKKVYIHAFTDGRDTDPKSGIKFLDELQQHLDHTTGTIATVTGRYYAMDRDHRWERIKIAYDALVQGIGEAAYSWKDAVNDSYHRDITDEFIKPIIISGTDGRPVSVIAENDTVICFNFRTDRCREITQVLTQTDMPEWNMYRLPLHYITLTRYDESFKNIQVVYEKNNLNETLGEVLSMNGIKQIRIAETEKYPHVTFFFNGGRETPFEGETRMMINSPKVATYDLQPEMSAPEITEGILREIEKGEAGFICLNFANADMVGHTGVFSAAVKAVETVDKCLGKIITAGINKGYDFIIIADHGNADMMINGDGSPNTAHTTNPVPCILISADKTLSVHTGRLADVAPTLLQLMQLKQPAAMTGRSLINRAV